MDDFKVEIVNKKINYAIENDILKINNLKEVINSLKEVEVRINSEHDRVIINLENKNKEENIYNNMIKVDKVNLTKQINEHKDKVY